jgi:hypothetical protein
MITRSPVLPGGSTTAVPTRTGEPARRLGLLLARQGIRLNHKNLYRLCKEERLTVRKRGGRKRALTLHQFVV